MEIIFNKIQENSMGEIARQRGSESLDSNHFQVVVRADRDL